MILRTILIIGGSTGKEGREGQSGVCGFNGPHLFGDKGSPMIRSSQVSIPMKMAAESNDLLAFA